MSIKRNALCLLPLWAARAILPPVHADLTAANWAESWTDPSNSYILNPSTQSGTSVTSPIPTDATTPDIDVVNYYRTNATLAGGDGAVLGDLSGDQGLTATFNLYNNTLALGATFLANSIVGETYSGETGNNAGIRLVFTGADSLNIWWSDFAVATVTSMSNGQDVTLTADFDPSQWSNYNGINGSADTADFDAALSDVTKAGLSFGSGYFFSDGFAFNTGGTADIQLDSFSTTTTTTGDTSVPEPTSILLLATVASLACLARRKSQHKRDLGAH